MTDRLNTGHWTRFGMAMTCACICCIVVGPLMLAEAAMSDKDRRKRRPLPKTLRVRTENSKAVKLLGEALRPGLAMWGRISKDDSRLDDGSAFDIYNITVPRNAELRISMQSNDLDCYLLLTDGDLETLAEDDDSGSGFNSEIVYQIRHAGTYYVVANTRGDDDYGTYRLALQVRREGNVTGTQKQEVIQPAQSFRDELEDTDPRLGDNSPADAYVFEAAAGQWVVADLESSDFDAYLILARVVDGEVKPLATDDDSGMTGNARIVYRVPADGELILVASTYNPAGRGKYKLTFNSSKAPETPKPSSLRTSSGRDPKKRYALLIGIDDYPGDDSDLPSSVADTRVFGKVLQDRYGFHSENILYLHNAAASRSAIMEAARKHLGQAGPDGVAVLYYSGHGVQLEDNADRNDPEPDGIDEALTVPAEDGESCKVILDDEIGAMIREIGCKRSLVVLDCCCSGTGTRNWRWRPKGLDVNEGSPPIILPTGRSSEQAAKPGANGQGKRGTDWDMDDVGPGDHILLAAARADEVAYARSGGWPSLNGVASVFTYFLAEEMLASDTSLTFRDMTARVGRNIRNHHTTRTQKTIKGQQPQAEGTRIGMSVYDFLVGDDE